MKISPPKFIRNMFPDLIWEIEFPNGITSFNQTILDDVTNQNEIIKEIREKFLASLTPDEIKEYELYFCSDISLKEIAKESNVEYSAVRQHKSRLVAKLKKTLNSNKVLGVQTLSILLQLNHPKS